MQHGIGNAAWQGTAISTQGAICDHMAGPVSVLPDEGTDVEPECETGETMVDVTELTAITNGKRHWMNQAMRLAHAATHAAKSAEIEAEVAVHQLLLVGRTIETYLGEHPAGTFCRGEVVDVSQFCISLYVRFEGREYDPEDESFDIVDIDQVRLVTDE